MFSPSHLDPVTVLSFLPQPQPAVQGPDVLHDSGQLMHHVRHGVLSPRVIFLPAELARPI